MEQDFLDWANSFGNEGIGKVNANLPPDTTSTGEYASGLEQAIADANKTPDTSDYSVRTADQSARYPRNYEGVSNEELYAQNQTSWDKAQNGVIKMVGTAGTTFVNGTVGLVYGSLKSIQDQRFASFYDNPLTRSLNDLSHTMEDSYAHYQTQRQKDASWWEPVNLFSGNLLWDGIVKNLGFGLGAAASGFAWGAGLKAIGLTSKLMSTGAEMAANADKVISESTLLPQIDRLSNINAELSKLVGKGLMKTDRAVTATFAVAGEAGMESLNNSQEFRQKMIENFQDTHGYYPQGVELEQINRYSEKVGNWSLGANAVLLTISNYVQLPKIYSSSFKGEKQIVNNIVREGDKYVSALPKQGFGKLIYGTKNVASLFFNRDEAIEEGSQYAIQTGTQNYFGKKYRGEKVSAIDDGALYGINQALTTPEGTLNIFLGGLSGALQSSGVVGIKKGESGMYSPTVFGTGKIGERGFTGYGGEDEKLRDAAIDLWNKSQIKDKIKDAYLSVKAAENIQQNRKLAVEQGDILESKDLEFDYAHNFIANRLNYNAKELITEEINSLKQEAATTDGFLKLQQEGYAPATDTKETFLNRLTNLQEHADHAATLKEAVDIKYKGLVDKKTNKPLYPQEVLDQLVYAGSKVMDYNKRIPQVNFDLINAGILNTQQIVDEVIETGTLNEPLAVAAKAQIDAMKGITSTQKDDLTQKLRDLMELSLRKKQFIDDYNEIIKTPAKFEKQKPAVVPPPPTPKTTQGKKAAKTIALDNAVLEINSSYFKSKDVDYEKDGINAKSDVSRFTVLGENPDGTLDIQNEEGVTEKVTKAELAKYNIRKADDVLSNPAANFQHEFRDKPFEYNFGEFGGNVTGRLEHIGNKLYFIYLSSKNKVETRQVFGKFFVGANEERARIYDISREVETSEQEAARKLLTSQEELDKEELTLAKTKEARLDVIAGIEKDTKEELAKVEKELAAQREIIKKIQDDFNKIAELEKTGAKKTTGTYIANLTAKSVIKLGKEQEKVNKQIAIFTAQKKDLQINLQYFKDLSSGLGDFPENTGEFLDELNTQLSWIDNLAKQAGKSIDELNQESKTIQDTIKDLLKLLKSNLSKDKNLIYSDDVNILIDSILDGTDVSTQIPALKEALAELIVSEDIQDQKDKVAVSLEKLEDINTRLQALTDQFDEVESVYAAARKVIDKFQGVIDTYNKKKKEEQVLQKNPKLREEYTETLDDSVQNFFGNTRFEPVSKKPWWAVVGGTFGISIQTEKDKIKPHQVRANRFGNRFNLFDENKRENIKGIVVTKKTEKQVGLDGLVENMLIGADKTTYKSGESIVLVMVQDNNDGTFTLVDEFGDPFAERNSQKAIDTAIYQSFPRETLEASYKNDATGKFEIQSMFRQSENADHVRELKTKYEEWRTGQLAKKNIDNPVSISASFGIPEYVYENTVAEGHPITKRDYAARTSVEAAGLLPIGKLQESQVVMVATTNDIQSEGDVTFANALGRVFLKIPGIALVKLKNRLFTDTEANVIFDVLHQITKNAVEEGTVKKGSKSTPLFDWLKSVAYWGIVKDPDTKERKKIGHNNMWFEDVNVNGAPVTKLFISGKQINEFDFTTTSLEENKTEIIGLIKQIYNNANASKTNGAWDAEYTQIVGINPDGTAKTVTWSNYQTYLLSEKAPDPNNDDRLLLTRNIEDIPLTTDYRPLDKFNKEDTNRQGVYFKLSNAVNDFATNVKKDAEQKTPPPPTPPANTSEFTLDGVKRNAIDFIFGRVSFILNGKKAAELLAKDENNIFKATTESEKADVLANFVSELIANKAFTFDPISGESLADIVRLVPTVSGRKTTIEDAQQIAIQSTINRLLNQIVEEGKQTTVDVVNKDEITITPLQLSNILTSNNPTQSFINKFLGLDITDERAIKLLEDKGIISKSEGAAPRKFLKSLKEALADIEGQEETTEENNDWVDDDDLDLDNLVEDAPFRLKITKEAKQWEKEDWDKIGEEMRATLPNVSIYRVKNAIQATNGKQAWGLFRNGAIYIDENAEIGTFYHEVFHAIWRMFTTPAEQRKVEKEFRNRDGQFLDRKSEKLINYKDATTEQVEDAVAEEYREARLANKNVASTTYDKSFIGRLFTELRNFIKAFFTGEHARTNTANLFSKIGNGYYAKYNPNESELSYANVGIMDIDDVIAQDEDEFRMRTIPSMQLHDIMQHMSYSILTGLTKTNQSLLNLSNPDAKTKSILYNQVKQDLLGDGTKDNVGKIRFKAAQYTISKKKGELSEEVADRNINDLKELHRTVNANWDELVRNHEQRLASYNIKFDEEDIAIVLDENNSGKSDYQAANKIDSFSKVSSAIKLMLGTLPLTEYRDGKISNIRSSIGGIILMPADQVYVTLLNHLHDAVDINQMFEKLNTLGQGHPNYAQLYTRLTKQDVGTPVNWSAFEDHDITIISAFWNAMKKQNADVITVFILPSGEVIISNSALSSAAKESKRQMLNNIIDNIKSDASKYFTYNADNGKYTVLGTLKNKKLETLQDHVDFLKDFGVTFNIKDLQDRSKVNGIKLGIFKDAVAGIRESFSKMGPVLTRDKTVARYPEGDPKEGEPIDYSIAILSDKSLNIAGQLMQLGTLKASLENPDFESTYFNINGERTQTYIGTNASSNLFDVISKLTNIDELRTNERYSGFKFLVTDKFTRGNGSLMLQRMFNIDPDAYTGNRRDNTEDYMKPILIDGMINEATGKKKESSKQTMQQQLIQEINLNIGGIYKNLVPGDASLDYATKMHDKNRPFVTEESFKNKTYLKIFRDYFIAEVELSRDNRTVVTGKSATDLRFFKAILADNSKKEDEEINKLHNDIITAKDSEGNALTPDALYKAYQSKIDAAVEKFISDDAKDTRKLLIDFGIIYEGEQGLALKDLSLAEDLAVITMPIIQEKLNLLSVNYMIANIELHKLLYSDPYQYSDELKRIKNFNSPRQPLVYGSSEVNSALNSIYNKLYSKKDIGHTDLIRNFFRTVTISDVLSSGDLKGYDNPWKETDGGGYITLKGNRIFRLRAGTWLQANEQQYQYDIIYEKRIKGEDLTKDEKKKLGLTISKKEEEIWAKGNPDVKDTYTPLKPIVAGSKDNGRDYNDIVLHKFALLPLSFRLLHEMDPNSNAIKLYNKMQGEDIDYAVYETGSKVGTEKVSNLYVDGKFDTTPFSNKKEENNPNVPQGVSKIPFSIVGVQSEVPSKDTALVTQGSQMTKLVTLDFMDAGVPIDFDSDNTDFNNRFAKWTKLEDKFNYPVKHSGVNLYKEIKNNEDILNARIEQGYITLLQKLGIKEIIKENGERDFEISDKDKLVDTLRAEVEAQQVNDNILAAFSDYKNGKVVLEATPSYQQIRNILYSIADSNVVSQKISGGMKVQVSSALFESGDRVVQSTTKDGKVVYSSDILKFYTDEDGKRVCEIMVARWFKSDRTDAELLAYFDTPEGKAEIDALFGVAYRIPTQKQNSIDAFKVAKFLPYGFGDSVVIPSALVQKVGSDFDIDKLSIYLKNVRVGKDGYPKVIKYLTDENSTDRERYYKWVTSTADKQGENVVKFLNSEEVKSIKQGFKNKFNELNEEYGRLTTNISDTEYENLIEEYNDIANAANTSQEFYLKDLNKQNAQVFKSLPRAIKDLYIQSSSEVSKLGLTTPAEISEYLALTKRIIEDEQTKESTKKILNDMAAIYQEKLQVLGETKERIKSKSDAAFKEFRERKSEGITSIGTFISSEYKQVNEQKEEVNLIYAKELAEIANLPSFEEFSKKPILNQNTKKALENAYIDSLQNLVSHPLNFDNLIKPNSADQLKNLTKDINKELGRKEKDYSAVGNMLSRSFMASLRHAFVSGKYAIGIAATGQTNHAQNQRSNMYVDTDRLSNESMSDVDRAILGGTDSTTFASNPNINFQEYNSIIVNGKSKPSLSMVKNAAGEYISDIIGMFIDGFVDIAKGAWVMELGASPNVVSTWLFLTKIGVPINTTAYFMNQPIIKKYLNTIANQGYSWLFIDDIINDTLDEYTFDEELSVDKIPSETELFDMLKFNNPEETTELTDLQKAQQQYMLKEFLKYAKMAEHLFLVTQGSNFDTATINDPYLVTKKRLQLERARGTIISSVDNILNNSFIGPLKNSIYNFRDAFAEVLLSDRKAIRSVMESVLTPYANLNDRSFIKVSQKAVSDLFDWAIQTGGLNNKISEILLGDSDQENAAKQIIDYRDSILGNETKGIPAKPNHLLFNNIILNSIQQESGNQKKSKNKVGRVNNLYLGGRDNKVYDQNLTIYGFEELKKVLMDEDKDLYRKLVDLAVIQSGLTNSPIAFTTLLPYEDFKEQYNSILFELENMPNLADFYKLNVFERTNWNNSDVMLSKKAKLFENKNARFGENTWVNRDVEYLSPSLLRAYSKGAIPKVINISKFSQEGRSDFIVYSWELPISRQERIIRRRTLDTSHIQKMLLKKVYGSDGKPLLDVSYVETKKGIKKYEKYIYKAVNPWGDSFHAKEFYDKIQPSVLDNDFIKIQQVIRNGKQVASAEVEDSTIELFFNIDQEKKAEKTQAVTVIPTQATSKFEGAMKFKYGNNKRSDVTSDSTFDAILNGERTATTRYERDGNLDYWKQAKVGDIITWTSADGRTVDVEVTKTIHPLKDSGATPEAWSKLEGWSREYFEKNVRPKINDAWQIEYKLPSTQDLTAQPIIDISNLTSIVNTLGEANFNKILQNHIFWINSIDKEGELLNEEPLNSYSDINKFISNLDADHNSFTFDSVTSDNDYINEGMTEDEFINSIKQEMINIRPTLFDKSQLYLPLAIEGVEGTLLKDGKTYTSDQIDSTMLEAMGYTPNQIGEILKSIC